MLNLLALFLLMIYKLRFFYTCQDPPLGNSTSLMHMPTFYRWLSRKANRPGHLLFVNVVVAISTSYLGLKKFSGISVTELLASMLYPPAPDWIIRILLAIVIYVSVAKVFLIFVDFYPTSIVTKIEPDGLSACILKVNQEIENHLNMIINGTNHVIPSLLNAHSFDVNVRLVVHELVEHLIASLKSKNLRKRDVFVSVHQIRAAAVPAECAASLQYVAHYPETRNNVSTKDILLNDESTKDYYCVKCINEGHSCAIRSDCYDFAKGRGKRKKTIQNYVGFTLKANDELLGFVNIEFHKKCFDQDEELEEFTESTLVAFKLLIEYQFLKRIFFRTVHGHINN